MSATEHIFYAYWHVRWTTEHMRLTVERECLDSIVVAMRRWLNGKRNYA